MSAGAGARRAESAREAAFRASGVSHAYPRQRDAALDRIDLSCVRGLVLGLMGPNGSGKTTLLAVLATSLRPDAGTVDLFPGRSSTRDSARRRIAAVFDASPFADALSGRENLLRVLDLRGLDGDRARRRADRWLERFGLRERRHDPVAEYSHGMRRKTDLAAAFAADPELLLLDEPTAGLDAGARRTLAAALREHADDGGAAVVADHAPRFLEEVCGEVAFLSEGRLLDRGPPRQLMEAVDAPTILVVGLAAGAGSGSSVPDDLPRGVEAMGRTGEGIRFRAPGGAVLPELCEALQAGGGEITSVRVRRPDLDDAFLARTGRSPAEDPA